MMKMVLGRLIALENKFKEVVVPHRRQLPIEPLAGAVVDVDFRAATQRSTPAKTTS
jgi:hypothetical protein